LALLLALLLAGSSMGGCAWWEKNVTGRVKNITTRRLIITSDPPGADVFVDDVYQGQTPLTLTYSVGLRDIMKGFTVTIQKEGYLPLRREVTFQTENLTFRLIRQQGQ